MLCGWADTQTVTLVQGSAWSRDCSSGWWGNQTLLNYTSRRWRQTKSQPYWNSECMYAICIGLLGDHWQALTSLFFCNRSELCSAQLKQRNVSISYAGQLCKQPDLGREKAEEQSHLTCFSKNTQAQNSSIFSYLTFMSWIKEKEVPSRVKMYSVYMLVFFKKPPQLKQQSIVNRGLLLWTNVYWGCWDFLEKSSQKFLTSFYLTWHNSCSASKALDTHYAFHSNPRVTDWERCVCILYGFVFFLDAKGRVYNHLPPWWGLKIPAQTHWSDMHGQPKIIFTITAVPITWAHS